MFTMLSSVYRTRALVFTTLLLTVSLAFIACGDDDSDLEEGGPFDEIMITIEDDGLDPDEVAIQVGNSVIMEVTNESSEDCIFDFDGYLIGLSVPAGDTSTMSFLTSAAPGEPGDRDVVEDMGCRDDDERRGTVIVRPATAMPAADPID